VFEWLPQESIVFDRVNGRTETVVRLAGDATFIGLDLLCLGRTASGERLTRGRCGWRRASSGWPADLERAGPDRRGSRLLDSPVGLSGQPVTGSLLVASDALDAGLLAACRGFARWLGTAP
jgi:urease accessory protein